MNGGQRPRGDNLNLCFLQMLENTFSLGEAHLTSIWNVLNSRTQSRLWKHFICVFNVTDTISESCYYSEICVRKPPLRLTVVDVERWLSYKGTCHVILLAKLHDLYLYKTDNFFQINHYLKSISKVALLHRFHCKLPNYHTTFKQSVFLILPS